MIYRTVAIAVIAAVAWFLAMRYNLHMLQLNGYKNGEHLRRTVKNCGRQWLLLAGLVPGVLQILLPGLVTDFVCAAWLLLTAWIYNLMRKTKAKKKLVYTARVKRLVAFHIALNTVIPVLVWVFFGPKRITGVLTLLTSLQWILLVVSNFLMKPAEKMVGQHYINDAKRKLRASGDRLTIIGVTGSYGKTSVKFYLKTLLSARFDVLVTPESFNTPMGVVRTIREQLKPSHEVFVCEMGARHVGDIKEICDIVHPSHGIITSIGPQHLETFFSMENIRKTKFELADALPAGGKLILNGDNEEILTQAASYPQKIFYHAGEAKDGYCAKNI